MLYMYIAYIVQTYPRSLAPFSQLCGFFFLSFFFKIDKPSQFFTVHILTGVDSNNEVPSTYLVSYPSVKLAVSS